MNCPDCNLYMDLVSINGFDVNWCYKCKGIWLISKTLKEILFEANHPNMNFLDEIYKLKGVIKKRHCPSCKEERLYEFNVDSILVDQCLECHGVFFEEGELSKLVPNVQRQEKDDLNYQDLPYSPTDYFRLDADIDKKVDRSRKPIGSWQSIVVFLLFMLLLVLQLMLTNE